MRLSILSSALVAILVGFGGTIAVIIAAAQALGADAAQTSSWVTGICLSMAATSAWFSWRYKQPIITAWSTPGAALIAAGGGIALDDAIGAFLLAALLLLLTAAIRPVARAIERIPAPVAAAMLAGVLLNFVIAIFAAIPDAPALILPLIALFFVIRIFSPTLAVIGVLLAGVGLAYALGMTGPVIFEGGLATLTWVTPGFDPAVLIGLGLPLYLVTMASQNLPGSAVLRAAGYTPPIRGSLAVTGLASLITAPFAVHTTNMAAITAALCTGPDTHPDPAQRWRAGVVYGAGYLVPAGCGAALVALFAALPALLITAVAGLALLGPLTGALGTALGDERERTAAVVTLVITASGLSLFGIGAPFWGLAGGLAVLGLAALGRRFARG